MSSSTEKRSVATWQWTVVLPILAVSVYYLIGALKHSSSPPRWESDVSAVGHSHAGLSKIRREGNSQFLWAKGPKNPKAQSSEWFDLTGSPLPLKGFQFGIGRDSIPSIDHPVFVKPDDPKLRLRWGKSRDANIDSLRVIGYEHNGVARAYPIALLNRHELVNDVVGGKPVTVGW